MRNCRIFHFENGGGVRWTQNGPEVRHLYAGLPQTDGSRNFPDFARSPPRPPKRAKFPDASSEMAIFDEKKAEMCIRLERNGHVGLKKGQN